MVVKKYYKNSVHVLILNGIESGACPHFDWGYALKLILNGIESSSMIYPLARASIIS